MMGWLKPSKAWKRMISVLTILALLVTTMPVSLAAGSDATWQQASSRRAILAEEATLEPTAEPTPTPTPTPTPEVSETAIPDPTPDPSGEPEPTVTPEESVSPEPSLSPSPSPLPYDLPGMPTDFVLSDDQMHAKEVMSTKDILSVTEALTPGEDYVDNQVMFWADSKEYAETVAAAYNGELVSYSDHIALVELRSTTVMQALSVAADTMNNMPALDANHIITLWPDDLESLSVNGLDTSVDATAPKPQSWYTKPNDTFLQNAGAAQYQWMHDMVNTYEAWGVTTGSSSIKVAVVDSGVKTTHEELSGKVTVINMTDITGVSNDDTVGHGTHVAGIIAAKSNNSKGGAGIAPGVSILSLTALPGGDGDDAKIAVAIQRAVAAGAHIINMSFGGYWYNGTMDYVIQSAIGNNVACIAAMGNDGSNSYCYPAAYSGVIAVAAVNSDYSRAFFSNYGSWADVAAPGVDIYAPINSSDSAYGFKDGTSMATPVVCGVAALYLSMTGRISPSTLEKKLESCVTKSSSSSIGAGIVDASKLFSADKTPPKITVKNTLGNVITSFTTPIPLESTLTIESGTGATNAKMILYTTDGTTPSVKNGEVVNGTVYSGQINLSGFKAGVPITFKAVCISGMGVMSSSTTVKFTLSLSSSISSLTMSGVSKITAGGKATYTAAVLPISSVSQKVLWSIVNRTNAIKAAISSTGVLVTAVNDGGEITIRATSNMNPEKYVEKVVTIEAKPFLKSIKLDYEQMATVYYKGRVINDTLTIVSAINTAGASVDPNSFLKQWSSSNTNVATVDQNGNYTVVGSGNATIKCLALDGSGKYATCLLNIVQIAESVSITGQTSIAPGKYTTYKATVLPTNTKTKTVTWSLEGEPLGVTISTSGVVKVPSTVYSGSFTVVASAAGGSVLSNRITVSISPLCTGISLTSSDSRVIRNSYSTITSATIFTRNTETTTVVDNILKLGFSINGNSTTPVWSSSSPTVASVDQTGQVTGLKAGSATITCTTQDGSGRKAAMKVTVAVPISYLTIGTKAPRMMYDTPTIAFGKSVANTVTYGDTFGTPTIKKVVWTYAVYEINSSGTYTNRTSYYAGKKMVSLSSSGVLTVASSMYNEWNAIIDDISIYVTAIAADGSGVYDSLEYFVQPATSVVWPDYSTYTFKGGANKVYAIYFDTSSYYNNFTVTSSNPKVAGLKEGCGAVKRFRYYAMIYAAVPGTAIITIKANDGSGRYANIKVIVN